MKAEIKRALEIAESYRTENDGEIPVLIVANDTKRVETIIIGSFRKKHETEDQKIFCSVLRMAFAMRGVDSYVLIVKPTFNYAAQMTKNVLAIVSITDTESVAEFFEIEDTALVPYVGEMPVEGMFTQLIPSIAEVNHAIGLSSKTKDGINSYIDACTYKMQLKPEEEVLSGFDMLAASMNAEI